MSKLGDGTGGGTTFFDILMNISLFFAALFILQFIQAIIEDQDKKKVDSKAEFLITVTWEKSVDVDTYLEDPVGNVIYFRNKDDGLMHLDRDDLGHDRGNIGDGIGYPENIEIITIRGVMVGEYVLNVQYYSYAYERGSVEVTITVEKLNPSVTLIAYEKVVLEDPGDEHTVLRFTLDDEGSVVNTNKLRKSFVGID